MFRFGFDAFVTDGVLAALAEAGQCPRDEVAGLRPVLAKVFEHVGGLPFCESIPPEAARTQLGLRWLREAVGHRLSELGLRPRARKLLVTTVSGDAVASYAAAHDPIAVNEADAETIRRATGLSRELANAVIAERRRGGRFSTLKEFERRVDGIGPLRAAQCEASLHFDTAGEGPAWRPADPVAGLRLLLQRQPSAKPLERLAGALEDLATSVATHPHPASRDFRVRQASTAAGAELNEVAWVGELFGEAYWSAMPALFDSATRTIEVCMFHAVAGGAQHPTRKILEALIRAQRRGVGVRVLLDRDNPRDPYRSTLINASARHLLSEGGVPVRQDAGNRLLHSKFQLIDDRLAIVGSHNWSEGSYFTFDDLSLAIESTEYTTRLRARFDRLWATATP